MLPLDIVLICRIKPLYVVAFLRTTDSQVNEFKSIKGGTMAKFSQFIIIFCLIIVGGWNLNAQSTSFFIFTWKTTSPNEVFELPLKLGLQYTFLIDWGDGNTDQVFSYDSPTKSHIYTSPGTYTVRIGGLLEG